MTPTSLDIAYIKDFCQAYGIINYVINSDGTINVDQYVAIDEDGRTPVVFRGMRVLPIKFGVISGTLSIHNHSLQSYRGFPSVVDGELNCAGIGIRSMSGFDNIVKEINGVLRISGNCTHLLGLVNIKGITHFDVNPKVDDIINRHIQGDMLALQDELLDAGFVNEARL